MLGCKPLLAQPKHETAGSKSLKASNDNTKYDGREVAEGQMHDMSKQMELSARAHRETFDEPYYYVIMQKATDPLLTNLVRQKYYCYPHMPSPRPEQVVYVYDKEKDFGTYLWSLPDALKMATISEMTFSDLNKDWHRTKLFCDAFYKLKFWECIRKMYGDHHLSESEFLKAHGKEIKDASRYEATPVLTETFDFTKIMHSEIVNPS